MICLFYWGILKEHLKSLTLQSKIPAAFFKSAETFVYKKRESVNRVSDLGYAFQHNNT
jgi:hypothetical protein